MKQKTLNYNSAQISSIDIDDEIETLISSCNLNVPELKTEQMQDPKIVPVEEVRSQDALYRRGQLDKYEFIIYTVPFEGNSKIFLCKPIDYNGRLINVYLEPKSFSIKLSKNRMMISPDDQLKAELTSLFSQKIEIIENILGALRAELEEHLVKLKDNLKSYIHSLEKEIKEREAKQIQKKNSESDMNPFSEEE